MNHPVTVLVFGTFDGIHDGHRFFLSQARALGDRLAVVVARDATARQLGKRSVRDENARCDAIRAVEGVDEARLGDDVLGTYRVMADLKPGIIAFGHDQTTLENDLKRWAAESKFNVKFQRIGTYGKDR